MLSLDKRLDKAEEMIKKPSFRENKGLGNEVGYYIFDYPAEKELYVRERIEYIKKKNKTSKKFTTFNDEEKGRMVTLSYICRKSVYLSIR